MLKLSQKRGRDWNEEMVDNSANLNNSRSPRRNTQVIPFATNDISKKSRKDEMMVSSPNSSPARSPVNANPFSFFPPSSPSKQENTEEILKVNLKSKPINSMETNNSIIRSNSIDNNNNNSNNNSNNNNNNRGIHEKLFSYAEVKEIVHRCLLEKESALRAEYDVILQERLQEQYRNFAKFNEDYISRQFKQSDFSYLS